MDQFKIISANAAAEKKRFVVHPVDGGEKTIWAELSAAWPHALKPSTRITEEHLCDGEWFAVVHYLFEPRGARLQEIRRQRLVLADKAESLLSHGYNITLDVKDLLVALDKEIAELEKEAPQ